jgi:hypothetical protein
MLIFIMIILAILCIFGAGYSLYHDNRRWEEFRVTHDCKVIGKMNGALVTTVGPAIGGNGGVAIGVGVTPDKTGWLCNDGMTYWR